MTGRIRVSADRQRCIGAGQCVLSSAAVFDQDRTGVVVVLDPAPAEAEYDAVREAAYLCPSGAVQLTTS